MSQEVPSTAEPRATGQPRAETRSRGLIVGGVIGFFVLILFSAASLAVIGDLTARTVEMDRLLTAVEASESAMKTAQDQVTAAMEPYASGSMTDAQRLKLQAELKRIAAEGQAAIGAAGQDVGAVQMLPWHSRILDAQQAYLRHNAAWVAYMTAAADQPDEWFAEQPEVNQSFADAKDPFVRAVTLFDIGNALGRVKAIFASDQPEESGGSGNTEAA